MKTKLQQYSASISGFILVAALTLALPLAVQADDIDIYTQQQVATTDTPLVIIALDMNLNLQEVVCSNVLADVATVTDEGDENGENAACAALQQLAVVPVLGQLLNLDVTGVLSTLLGPDNIAGGLLGFISGSTQTSLAQVATALRDITDPPDTSTSLSGGGSVGSGSDGTGATAGGEADTVDPLAVLLNKADVIRLLLYQVLHQLVGVKVAVVVNNANTCETFAATRRNTEGCSNGAYFLLEATELLEDNIDSTVDSTLARLQDVEVGIGQANAQANSDTSVAVGGDDAGATTQAGAGVDFTPPFQGKEVYYEIFQYLTGGEVYNAPINDDNAFALAGAQTQANSYNSPLTSGTCEDIYVINVMFSDSQQDDESDDAIRSALGLSGDVTWEQMIDTLANTGFQTDDGNRYKIKSRFLVNGLETGPGALLSNLVGTTLSLPLNINPLAVQFTSKENFVPVASTSASFGGLQTVLNRSNASQVRNELYLGQFKPDPDRAPAWRGNLKKFAFSDILADTDLAIVDAIGAPAIAPNGSILPTSLSFWTDPAGLPDDVDGTVDGRDGPTVDRGGAGMFLNAPYTEPTPNNPPAGGPGSNRFGPVVYYQLASNNSQSLNIGPLNLTNATAVEAEGDLGVPNELRAAEIIAYARGFDTPSAGQAGYTGFLQYLSNTVGGLTSLVNNVLGGVLSLSCRLLGIGCPAAVEPPPQPWVMGDVLHSHPLPIDYGSANGDPNIRIFTGTNKGFLHQFRDSGPGIPGGTQAFGGQEVWRLTFRENLKNMERWKSATPLPASRPYGVDGAPVALVKDLDGVVNASDGDKVYVYVGLRRGGKAYYGLDVTNPNEQPTGLWTIRKTSGANSDFAELGLTFSTPKVARMRIADTQGNAQDRDVLIFGGGYDGGYESNGTPLGKDAARGSNFDGGLNDNDAANTGLVGQNDDEGNAVFIVDAETGALIWKARRGSTAQSSQTSGKTVWEHPALTDSIPSDVTALDTTGDGFTDRLYVGDTGGKVWRADIGNIDTSEWRMAPIASLGRHDRNVAQAVVSGDRRFFARPDVVRVSQGGTSYFTVILGSGDRADPLNRETENYLYVIKDSGALDTQTSTFAGNSDLADFSENCSNGTCSSLLDVNFSSRGWRLRLGPDSDADRAGEKALSSPVTIGGKVLFTSYIPPRISLTACTPQEGTGRLYAIDLRTGQAVVPLFAQDGEPGGIDHARGTPLTAAGIPAGVTYVRSQQFLTSDNGITQVDHRSSWRTYWRERDGER